MRKIFIAFICMAAGLLSCTNDDNIVEDQAAAGVPMTFNITVDEMATTRAAKTAWAEGDKIYVFFYGLGSKYLLLTYSGGAWINNPGTGINKLTSDDFRITFQNVLTAVHFPVAVDVAFADNKFSFTSGGKPVYTYYLCETYKPYTLSGTTVTATLSMGKPACMVQIHVAGIQDNVGDYTFGCSKIKPVACASVGSSGGITESELQAGARLSGFADTDGGIFAGKLVSPDEAKDYKFTLASDDKIYTLTRTGKALTAGKMYNFPAPTVTGGSNWAVQNASDLYVDLGLSVKWAKYNVGATTETDNGDYFAWGETTGYNEGKTNFAWSTYAWGKAEASITKYCNKSSRGKDGFTDALTTLEKEDDAAYAALGGKFRMPTDAEVDALIATKTDTENYTWTWCDGSTEKYNDSTTPGWKIVRNSTSATLFLPAAGRLKDTSLGNVGTLGLYWSSSLDTDYPNYAWYINFGSTWVDRNRDERTSGRSVRPVSE